MHSPLPDSTALEAGIIADSSPSRLSRVQDNVRNLLRSSMLGSIRSSPRASAVVASPQQNHIPPPIWQRTIPHPVASPSAESVSSIASDDSSTSGASTGSHHSTDMLIPPTSYQQAVRHMTHQSAMFDTRAVAALNHPDLSDPSLATTMHRDARRRQRHAWKRSRHHHKHARRTTTMKIMCVVLGLFLAGLVASYIALSTTIQATSTAIHISFIFGIVVTAVAFFHSLARLWFVPKPSCHHRKHTKSRRRPARLQAPPTLAGHHDTSLAPHTPVPVILADDDEVRLDPDEAKPSSAVHQPSEVWQQDAGNKVPNPPPAYGRWRGSVRADPEMLHWQTVNGTAQNHEPISLVPAREGSPSNFDRSPPSYKVKATPPPAKRIVNEAAAQLRPSAPEPEMIEGRGIGL